MKAQLLERKYAGHDGLSGAPEQIVANLQRFGDLLRQLQDSLDEARH